MAKKFYCPEISDSNGLFNLFEPQNINPDTVTLQDGAVGREIIEIGQANNGQYQKIWQYGNRDIVDLYFRERLKDIQPQTIAELATATGLTIDKNFTDTVDYFFRFNRVASATCSMWFVVLTENGLYFAIPERLTTSKQLDSNLYTVLSNVNMQGDIVYSGETGGDFSVSVLDDMAIIPETIADAQKIYRINKAYATRNTIKILVRGAYGREVELLDYVQYNGDYYLAINKIQDGNEFIIDCVMESTESPSIAGDDVSLKYEGIGNGSGYVPLSNGTVNTNLNADMLDGKHLGQDSGQINENGANLIASKTVKTDANKKFTTEDYTRSYGTATGASTTLGNNAWTKIKLESNVANGGDVSWDNTNKRFYANKAGIFLVMCSVRVNNVATDGRIQCSIYKNGTHLKTFEDGYNPKSTAAPVINGGCITLSLSVNDYIEIYNYNDAGGTSVAIDTGTEYSWIAVEKVIYN